ncbi:DUF1905 domain-containing protein [Flammeovirga pacifica]|uniref:DUF1905 domain-containing protein n=1 Tax=Flammeovirga pacifica TaxID=915059 RepID=A0A1S1YT50_FLAPC|nr:DUF1905 domain-containing protein [Flammeovirga pacifica]OHX64211.1 hypothetical protein NH26_21645 [Flammeovirga pacifica]
MIKLEGVIQKFEGKGGWSYVLIPDIKQDKTTHFGWVTVSGSIDDYPLNKVKLMPHKNDGLFLPVKKEIRKKIKKEEGDKVFIKLYLDNNEKTDPSFLFNILNDISNKASYNFQNLHYNKQKDYMQWIFDSRDESTQEQRINQLTTILES